jgi:hypothetical protein
MLHFMRIAAIALASSFLAAGCGVRGQLQLPKEEAVQQTTATADSGQGKPANTAPKPHKDFFLDGLLR